ncbi:small EDRK-rich factor 2 [Melia azedarach]|uniref:Small EDRK-rich factor 2 n=1 Tax=Melia azedarach TaxID=155640 RepID=A0ACC1YJ14_MELAZ|nr:small EDRK-rich factor 2 [Melia azedarach]
MTRGNQRERDRERAQARGGAKGKNKDDGLTPEQRRERDAKALQEKAAKKAGQGATGGDSAAGKGNNKK